MPFTVGEFRDLVQILEQRPEWRAELRRLVLTDDLLALPQIVRELAEAQRRTEAELVAWRAETERRFQELAEAQRRSEATLEALAEAQRQMAEAQRQMVVDVSQLKQLALERRYYERAFAYFSRLVRRAHALSGDELNALFEGAVERGQLSEVEVDEIQQADVVVRGQRREDHEEVYLVVKVSWGVGVKDVQRAARRAMLLAKTGISTRPVVAGVWVTPDAEEAAQAMKVWRVTDGRVASPEPA